MVLKYIKNSSKLHKYNNEMSFIFTECSKLTDLPDISKWNTNNVTNMSCIFNGCSSLTKLPDISKWNTNNVTNMNNIFDGCVSLIKLPDILTMKFQW